MNRIVRHTLLAAIVVACLGGCPDPGSVVVDPAIKSLETQALNLVNAERARVGVASFEGDSAFDAIARAHSVAMIADGFFDHVDGAGETPEDRLAAEGIRFTVTAENIARVPDGENPMRRAVDAWLASAEHGANLRDATFTRAGLGVAMDTTKTPATIYITHVMVD